MLERKILIGLITSTEYCKKIQPIWDFNYIESSAAKLLAAWCWEHFDKYGCAPRKNIETIFYKKIKSRKLRVSKEVAEEIELDILPGLSTEYTSTEFNVKYLLEETESYFNERRLTVAKEQLQIFLESGEIDNASEVFESFRPVLSSSKSLNNFIVTAREIRKKKIKPPKLFLKPWLREGQTTIIYGNFGTGKSLLVIATAYILGLKEWDTQEAEIGEWQVKNSTGTLYIDGELGESEMEERVRQFEWIGKQHKDYRMKILSIPEYQLETEDSFYLGERINQLKIIEWLKNNPDYKLIVLDSASTLFGLKEENDNSEWSNKINPFLRDLRALGVACILLHHAGKDGKKGLRGASAMGAMAHNIYRITNHPQKNIDEGEAWFILDKDKQRSSGYSFKRFAIHFKQKNNSQKTFWEITDY